jgi:hypothetical protein
VRRLLADEHEGEGVDREPESVGDLEVVGGAEVVAVVEDGLRPRLSAPGFSLVDLRSTIAPGMRRSNRALCWIPLSSAQNADSSDTPSLLNSSAEAVGWACRASTIAAMRSESAARIATLPAASASAAASVYALVRSEEVSTVTISSPAPSAAVWNAVPNARAYPPPPVL